MISELIQKMQELAASDGAHNYEVLKIEPSHRDDEDIMVSYDCSYDDARQIEGMLSTNFDLDKSLSTVTIAIKRVAK